MDVYSMKKKIKIAIIIIVAICILIPVSVVAYNNYQYNKEQTDFNDTMKKVSAMENKTDNETSALLSNGTITITQVNDANNKTINTGNEEIKLLQNLSKNLTNETLKNYTDLEIERLTAENKAWELEIEDGNALHDYYNGNGSVSELTEKTDQVTAYANSTDNKKMEVEQYLARNPELKDRLNNLGIDEDFMEVQREDYNTNIIFK